MAFQIDERMMAPDRAIITLNKSRKDLDLTDRLKFKPGMLHYIIDEGRLLLSVTPFTDKDGQMKYFKDLPIDSNISEILDKVGDIKEVEIEVEKLNEKYTQIMNEINENSKGVASNKKGVENNAQDIKSNTQSIKSNTQDIANNMQSIKSNAEDIKSNLENVKNNTDSIKSNAESIKSNVKNIENNAEKIQVIDSELKEIGDKIDNIGNNSNSSNIINRVEVIDFANYKDVNFNDAITIENTLQAPIEKLIIKGRTVKNIIKTKTSSINMAVKDESTDLGYHTGTLELSEKISPNKTYTFYANVSNSDNGSVYAFQNIVLGKSDGDDWSYRLDNNEDKVKNGVFIKNFTTPANFKATINLYMKIICPNSNVLKDTVLDNIMLLEGTYSSEELNNRYIPNGLNSVGSNGVITIKKNDENISFKLPFADGLKKIDDAQDKLNFDLNQIIQRIKSTKLTGKEDWYFQAEEDGLLRFASDINIANTVNTVCDKFKEINITQKEEGYCFVGKAIHIKIASSKLHAHNVNDFKEYLKSNVVTLFSKLAQPRIYSIGSLKQFNDSKIIAEGSNGDSVTPMYNTREVILPFAGGLKSLGNIKDKIVTAKGEIVKNLDQIIITGKEKWQKDTSLSNNKYTVFVLSSIENKKANSNISCNTLKVSEKMLTSDNGYSFIVGGEGLSIKFLNLDLLSSDINGLIEWFKDNPTRVIYELKSPITYKINDLQFKNIKSVCENGNDKENNIIVKKDFETSVELPFKKELNGVRGTTYEIDYLNNKLSQKIEKAHLKEIAANRIVKENTLKSVTRFYIDTVCTNNLKGSKNVLSSDLCCNMIDYSTDEEGMCWDENVVGRLWIHTPKDKFSDVTELYNCIQEKDIVIYYELNEAIETYINLDDSLKTFNDTTHVSIEDDIKGEIDLKANCKDGIKSFSGEGNCIISNSCEGNVEDLVIKGKTLKNMIDSKDLRKICGASGVGSAIIERINNGVKYISTKDSSQSYITIRSYKNECIKPNTTYSFIFTIDKNEFKDYNGITVSGTYDSYFLRKKNRLYHNDSFNLSKGVKFVSFTTSSDISEYNGLGFGLPPLGNQKEGLEFIIKDLMLIEGDFSNKSIPSYFEGIKSMGEIDCSNVIGIRNKNLFAPPRAEEVIVLKDRPTITVKPDGSILINGTNTTSGGRLDLKNKIPSIFLKKNVSYVISSEGMEDIGVLWLNKMSDNSPLYNNTKPFVPAENVEVFFGINYLAKTYNNAIVKPQLEENIIATSYEPYVEKVNEIITKSCGKNLFNIDSIATGAGVEVRDNDLTVTTSSSSLKKVEVPIHLEEGKYTLKRELKRTGNTVINSGNIDIVEKVSGKKIGFLSYDKDETYNYVLTISNSGEYLFQFLTFSSNNLETVNIFKNVFLYKGTTVELYEPYEEITTVKRIGKNLLKPPSKEVVLKLSAKPVTTLRTNGTIVLNGTCADNWGRADLKQYFSIKLKKGTPYRLSGEIPEIRALYMCKSSDDKALFSSDSPISYVPEEDVSAYFRIDYRSMEYKNAIIKPQLEIGTAVTSYTPYEKTVVNSIISSGKNKGNIIPIKSVGKNLIDSSKIQKQDINYVYKQSLSVSGDTMITCNIAKQLYVKSLDENDKVLNDQIITTKGKYTIPENTTQIKIDFYKTKNWNQNDIDNIQLQLVEGTIVTPYEPYKEFPIDTIVSSGEKEGNKIVLKSVGKNLFDESQTPENIEDFGNNVKSLLLEVGKTYIYTSSKYKGHVTFRFYKLDSTYSALSVKDKAEFTVPIDTIVTKVHTDPSSKIMVEQGTIASKYEPYKEEETIKNIGKNLFNGIYFDRRINENTGEIVPSTGGDVCSDYIEIVNPITSLTYQTFSETNYKKIAFYDNNKVFIKCTSPGSQITEELTEDRVPSNTRYIVIGCNYIDHKPTNLTGIKAQLERGSVATSYEPFKEIFFDIDILANKRGNEAVVRSHGKNLFNDLSNQSNCGITFTNKNGKIYIDGTATALIDFRVANNVYNTHMYEFISNLEVGTSLCLSNNLGLVNYFSYEDNGVISYCKNSITIKKTYTNVGAFVRIEKGTTFNNAEFDIQLEEGTVMTPYEPCEKNTVVKNIGKNLLDESLFVDLNTTFMNGTLNYINKTGLPQDSQTVKYKLNKGNYMLSISNLVGDTSNLLVGVKIGKESERYINPNKNKIEKIVLKNDDYIKMRITSEKTTSLVNAKFNLQLEHGVAVTPYEHFRETFINSIIPINKQDRSKIVVRSCGKNLINFDDVYSGRCAIDRANGIITGTDTYNDVQFYVHLEKGKQYSFQGLGTFYFEAGILKGKQKGFVESSKIETWKNVTQSPLTFNFDSGIYSIHIPNFRGVCKNFQLEEGVVKTTYEPYRVDEKEIILPFDNGLKEFDSLDYSKGIIKEKTFEYNIQGDGNWLLANNPTILPNSIGFVFRYLPNESEDIYSTVICNNLPSNPRWDIEKTIFINRYKELVVVMPKNELEAPTIDGFKKWLQLNPTKILYKMKEPIIHKITINKDNILSIKDSITNAVIEEAILKPYKSNNVLVTKCGRNIFDGVMESGAWDNQGNILGLEDYVRCNGFVSVKPQHIYTLSSNLNGNGRITFFTFDKRPIYQIIVNKDSFLCPINAYFIKFDIYKENVSATDVIWVQLEENVKATAYEPYRKTFTGLTLPKKCEDIFGFDKIKEWTKIESTDIDYKEIEVTNDPLTVGRKNLLKNFKTIKGTTSLTNGDNVLAPISLSVKMDIGKIVLDNQKKLDDIIKIINNGLVGTVSDNAMAINLLSKGFIKRNS